MKTTTQTTNDGNEYDRVMAGTSALYVLADDGSIVRRDAPKQDKRGPGYLNGESRLAR